MWVGPRPCGPNTRPQTDARKERAVSLEDALQLTVMHTPPTSALRFAEASQ